MVVNVPNPVAQIFHGLVLLVGLYTPYVKKASIYTYAVDGVNETLKKSVLVRKDGELIHVLFVTKFEVVTVENELVPVKLLFELNKDVKRLST